MTYTLADLDANGSSTRNALLSRILDYFGLAVQLDAERAALPTALSLGTPYPNPATSEATLDLVMPGGAFVDIDVYDILGRRVMQPVSGKLLDAGRHEITLDVSMLAPGSYFVRVRGGDAVAHSRFTLVR
ncbi:MAG: T9SS type A sorting domain-containing protein [Rhodothermales bacterium]|nr:T9SS type A sorting domain-containing protein [Rhodothermales bacterium]